MENPAPHTLAEAVAAAQAWWRDAGVDLDYTDTAQGWLADPAEQAAQKTKPPAFTPPAPPPPAPKIRMGGDPATWPTDLPAFRAWWLEEPTLDAGGMNPRVAPRGEAAAPLMVMVPMPEKDDGDVLLSGPEGRLIQGFATAAGIDPAALHIMAALPRHMAAPDWAGLGADGLGEVLRHYIALAAPRRLLVLGRDVLSLIGHDLAQDAPGPGEIAIQGLEKLPMLAHYAPARLLGHAGSRAGLWRHWLDWTNGTT